MPAKKKESRNKSSKKNPVASANISSNAPGTHHGHDENKTGNKSSYQEDFDVDETDIDQRKDQYKDTPGNRTRRNNL